MARKPFDIQIKDLYYGELAVIHGNFVLYIFV